MCTGKEAKEEHDVVMSYSLMLQSQPFIQLSVLTNKAAFVVETFFIDILALDILGLGILVLDILESDILGRFHRPALLLGNYALFAIGFCIVSHHSSSSCFYL